MVAPTRPSVREKNAHKSHTTWARTRTTVIVARFRIRLKNFMTGCLNTEKPPSPLQIRLLRFALLWL